MDTKNCWEWSSLFFGWTTAHGFRGIFETSMMARRLFWVLLVFGCIVGFVVMTMALVTDFLQYKTVTSVIVTGGSTVTLPSVTICNTNAYSLGNILQLTPILPDKDYPDFTNESTYFDVLKDGMKDDFVLKSYMETVAGGDDLRENCGMPNSGSFENYNLLLGMDADTSEKDREIAKHLLYLNRYSMNADKAFRKLLQKIKKDLPEYPKGTAKICPKEKEMILECLIKGVPCGEKATGGAALYASITRFPHPIYCHCYTIDPLQVAPALVKRSGNTKSARMEFLLSANLDDFWPSSAETAGLRVAVHKKGVLPDMDSATVIGPGQAAMMAVTKVTYSRQKAPYGSKCDKIGGMSHVGKVKDAIDAMDYMQGISLSTCSNTRLALAIMAECGCYDEYMMPYYVRHPSIATRKKDILTQTSSKKEMKACSLSAAGRTCRKGEQDAHATNFSSAEECAQPCEEMVYETRTGLSVWPSTVFGKRSNSMQLARLLKTAGTALPFSLKNVEDVITRNLEAKAKDTKPEELPPWFGARSINYYETKYARWTTIVEEAQRKAKADGVYDNDDCGLTEQIATECRANFPDFDLTSEHCHNIWNPTFIKTTETEAKGNDIVAGTSRIDGQTIIGIVDGLDVDGLANFAARYPNAELVPALAAHLNDDRYIGYEDDYYDFDFNDNNNRQRRNYDGSDGDGYGYYDYSSNSAYDDAYDYSYVSYDYSSWYEYDDDEEAEQLSDDEISSTGELVGFEVDHESYGSNMVKLQVYFDELNVKEFREDIVTSTEALVAAIAGLLGLFLGFSAQTFGEFGEFFWVSCYKGKCCGSGKSRGNRVTQFDSSAI